MRRPDDEHFQFGYAGFEALFNLGKGLVMGFVSLFALVSATMVIAGVAELDHMRARVVAMMRELSDQLTVDVLFTEDPSVVTSGSLER